MKRIMHSTLVLMLAAGAPAGPLTPPGAPAPTMKTLDEVEARTPIDISDIPITITAPGSYYLTENGSFPGIPNNGITVNASYVTIDLNGYTLQGDGANGPNSVSGIQVLAGATDVTIRNGTLVDWRIAGIRGGAESMIVENITASENGQSGIRVTTGTVRNCIANNNLIEGIVVYNTGIVSGCVCTGNHSEGLSLQGAEYMITGNVLSDNRDGIKATHSESHITRNLISDNRENGILLINSSCRVDNNTIQGNDINGIFSGTTGAASPTDKHSIIFQNVAANNPINYQFFNQAAAAAPIIDVSTTDTIATTNPWANFSY